MLLTNGDIKISKYKCPIGNRKNVWHMGHLSLKISISSRVKHIKVKTYNQNTGVDKLFQCKIFCQMVSLGTSPFQNCQNTDHCPIHNKDFVSHKLKVDLLANVIICWHEVMLECNLCHISFSFHNSTLTECYSHF